LANELRLVKDFIQPNPSLTWVQKVNYVLAILIGFVVMGAAMGIITAGEISVTTSNAIYRYRKMFVEGN